LNELKIVIADDSEAIRQQLQRAFSRIEGLRLIGLAENGVEAVRMVKALDPDLLVLDISMPHKSGLEVLREIRSDHPLLTIVIFTADPSNFLRETCLEAGADFHLDKTEFVTLVEICRELLAN
jgi:DNA-binding NarL/FixJ family response regulator